jgi:hypothetical protein
MSVKKLKTHSEIAAQEFAERSYTTLKQVQNDLTRISESVADNLSLLKDYQKKIAVANNFVIDLSTPNVNNSPVGKSNLKPSLVKNLEKNFAIIRSLWESKDALGALEAKLRMSKALGSDSATALAGIESVRKHIMQGLTDAGNFLSNQAAKSMPEEFALVVKNIQRLISRAIAYGDSTAFSYLFPDGDVLCYCTYIELKDVIDENGSRVPQMYVVLYCTIGSGMMGKKTYYMDVMHEFEPPSNSLLTSEINPAKMATVADALADLLQVSHFANNIKRIQINLLIAPESIKRELFSFSEYIAAVESNSDEQQLNFFLKPTVKDKALVDKIQAQLYLDVKGLVVKTRARMRAAITEKEHNGAKCTCISFFILRGKDAPAASSEDLEFLKERFNLSDKAVNQILVNINKD